MDDRPRGERWGRVEAVYHDAAALPVSERAGFLRRACGDDASMREEIEALLAVASEAAPFLEGRSARELAASFIAADGAVVAPPDRIGRYELVAPLGVGGMGTVFKARDTQLNRPVAVKFLSSDHADESARRRFQQEAQMASALNHPHILTVHEAGEFDGRQYLVTEFVDGGTLKTWTRSDTRTWRQCVELLVGVADGLATAHAAGIVHRDVKPDNILISKHGYAKLADFGLAKLFEAAGGATAAGTVVAAGRTQAGIIVGTIAYMSPEQAAGKPADARSDIFSFGVVLYEVLAGRQPFAAATELEVLQRVQHHTAEPLSTDIPPALRTVVEKALEKDPAERYQSMRDMVVDLRRLARQTVETRAPVTRRSSRWVAMAAAVLIAVAVGAGALWKMRPATTVEAPRIRSLAVLPLQNLSRDPDQEFFSDGTTEALISNLAQIHDLDVISRTSAMRYKGTAKTMREIGRELGADAIVEGSVQRVGGRVRITAQLIRASTDKHLWAREYERDAADVLTLEAEIARTIAQEIQAHLTPEEAGRLASARRINPDAREAFLLGRYHQVKTNEADLRQAIEYFQRAVQLQPDYAAAYAQLSQASFTLHLFTFEGVMRTAAAKAIELDPNLAEAYGALASIKFSDWDWAGAEQEARRARALNQQFEVTLPTVLTITRRHAEAIALVEHAVKLDPLSAEAQMFLGNQLYFARRYADALPPLKRALELEPRNAATVATLGDVYEMLGRPEEALAVFDRPEFRESLFMAAAYARLGRRDDALRVLNGVVKRGRAFDPGRAAMVYFALGDKERGFEWLTKGFDQRSALLAWTNVVPKYDGVRDDPRFNALVARLKLPN